ncbi:hypothetical protein Poli38472_000491 [Pythium oligandrum]|uniref:Uncharacterized protein n=1 Tax=Pythium oligandrum TaxID=41045 RepID=A0A8K1FGX3_PYTOL|nr:hypothetical protein Poli38472_000491 [Pythium oligandrum]|eukprot:TMW60449.1 hypothetical protein Poli38472_000491 [Pythium oligandrum]
MTDFAALIAALMSNDNNARKHAEETYQQLKQENPQTLVVSLVQLLRGAQDAGARAFAPVLLRRVIEVQSGVYAKLDAQTQLELKAQLLEAIAGEPVAHIRRKLGHVIAELASVSHVNGQQWPEVLTTVSTLSAHGEPALRETALTLVAYLAEYVGELLAPHKESFLTLFTNSLNDANGEVQIASLKAAASFLLTLEERQEIAAFGIIIAPMLRILEALLKSGDEVTLREVLSSLVQLAEVHATFFRTALEEVARAMLFIVSTQSLDDETRELALEFLLSLCENAGGMVRKAPVIVQSLVPLAIQLQCEVEDDEQWIHKFDDPETFTESSDSDENISDAGAAAIDRLSSSLGGAAVLPIAIPVITAYLQDQDWKKRRAALYTTCLLGEGSKALMTRELDNVVNLVLPFLTDAHPRVQYSAVHCVGQLAEDFGEVAKGKNFQARYHAAVLPALTAIIQNDGVLRTRALAASVIINFCNVNVCKAKYVKKHAQALLEALFHAMRSCPRQVQEQAITAVASVAKVIGEEFDRYYEIFMPLAKDVLVNASGAEYGLLRGKAMESIALIGQAVGKERFVADAKQVMEILVQVHSSENVEGPEVQYVAQACVRIGSILKEDFVPYLPYVVPPLLKQARIEPDVTLLDIEEDDDEDAAVDANGREIVTVEIRGVGKKRLQINTSALQDKTNACNMLYQCALDLEGAFYPYIEEVATVMLPLLKFQYIEDVRVVSALTLSRLLTAAVDGTINHGHGAAAPQFPQQLFEQSIDPLLMALQEEEEDEVRGALAEGLSALLEVCKESLDKGFQVGLPIDHVPRVVEVLKNVAAKSAQTMVAMQNAGQQDEDFDEEAALQQSETLELEEGIFRGMIDSIGWIIKTQREAFFPVFKNQLLPFVLPLLELGIMNVLRGQAICMIDDIIEHCGAAAQELVPMFITHLVKGLEDASPQVLQASAYGVGVCAEKTGAAFLPFAQESLAKLVHLVKASAAVEDDEVLAARDNAVSAVAKILLHAEGSVNVGEVWPVWLTWLPLRTDVMEARDLHGRFISWVAGGNKHILGAEFERLGAVLKIFAAILLHDPYQGEEAEEDEEEDLEIISEESKAHLRELLANLQSQLPSAVVQGAWATLTAEEQQAFAQLNA